MDDKKEKALNTMYNNLRDDNWQRGHGVWTANTILITGSLLIVFQTNFENVLRFPFALALILVANYLHLTTDIITTITYRQMETIGKEIGLDEIRKSYEINLKNKLWYQIRKGSTYVLYSLLLSGYVHLWLNEPGVTTAIFITAFFANLYSIFYFISRWKYRRSKRPYRQRILTDFKS